MLSHHQSGVGDVVAVANPGSVWGWEGATHQRRPTPSRLRIRTPAGGFVGTESCLIVAVRGRSVGGAFPAEAKTVSPEFVRIGTRLAVLEMIQSGTTTFADMYYFEEEVAQGDEGGGHARRPGADRDRVPGRGREDAGRRAEADRGVSRQFEHDDLITPSLAPHSVYTLDAATLTAAQRRWPSGSDVPIQIHLAETQREIGMSQERHKMRPSPCLDSLISGRRRRSAPTACGSTTRKSRCSSAATSAISNNPESNMKLASGTAPVVEYRQPASTSGSAPTAPPATTISTCSRPCGRRRSSKSCVDGSDGHQRRGGAGDGHASAAPARSAMEQRLGSLEAGKLADVIIVGMSTAAAEADVRSDLADRLCLPRRRCETTIVNGKVLMRDRKVLTLDEAQVLSEARTAADQVRKAVVQ